MSGNRRRKPNDVHGQESAMAGLAVAMADESRMKMLCALMDGRAWTATELATVADISPSTASAHLQKLVSGKLLVGLSQGRHRYFRLSGPEIALLLENMMGVSWQFSGALSTTTPRALRRARTCYDHLAGEVAVQIYEALLAKAWIAPDGSSLTECGKAAFASLGIAYEPCGRRRPCCACLDWSERRFHLGGAAGAALLQHAEQKGWLTRSPGYREVTITRKGVLALKSLLGINVDAA